MKNCLVHIRLKPILLFCCFLLFTITMVACNGDGDTAQSPSAAAEPFGEPTLVASTPLGTQAVATDGTWMAWATDYPLGIMYDDGTAARNLSAALGPEYAQPEGLAFDGQYVAFWLASGSLYYCEVLAAEPTPVLVTSTYHGGESLAIDNGVMVWHEEDGTDEEIFYYDLNADAPAVIQLTDNDTRDLNPRIDNGVIIWQGGSLDIDNDPVGIIIGMGVSSDTAGIYLYDLNASSPQITKIIDQDPFYLPFFGASSGYSAPQIDGGIITWSKYDLPLSNLSSQLFYYDLNAAEPAVVQIAASPAGVIFPQIDNGIIVWSMSDGTVEGIFSYDLNAITPAVVQVTADWGIESVCQIEDGVIFWRYLYSDLGNSITVNAFDIASATTSTKAYKTIGQATPVQKKGRTVWAAVEDTARIYVQRAGAASGPIAIASEYRTVLPGSDRLFIDLQLSDGILVWHAMDETDYEIYYCDLNAATPKVVQITDNDTDDYWAVVNGGVIAWNGYDGAHWKIFYYDLNAATPQVVQLSSNETSDWSHRIDDGVITWEGYDGHDAEIFCYDLHAANPAVIQVTDNDIDDWMPDIDHGILVWKGGGEIFYSDIYAAIPRVVQLTDNNGDNFFGAVDGGVITWRGNDGNDDEIFYFDLNAASPVVVQVTDNDIPDGFPLLSSGVITWTGTVGNDDAIFYFDLHAAIPEVVQLGHNQSYTTASAVNGNVIIWHDGLQVYAARR